MRPTSILLTLLALCFASTATSRTLQEVLNGGSLRVGVALSPPWALREAGELTGFEVDVARKLAEDMGVSADIRVLPWERLIPALEFGEIDLIAAGLTITPERARHVNFSDPYASGGVALATNLRSTDRVTQFGDLDVADYRIGAVADSVALTLARRLLPNATLVEFPSAEAGGNALADGEIDGFLETEPVPTFLALENPGVVDVPLPRPLLETRAGFAVNKGDPDFLAFLDAWIVARTADTWLPTTYNYWFESLRWRSGDARAPRR
jgi:polar amino acid transport system substrate-binding protein